ncbi:MarR family winged helix-turn-helix transcriptional regulator [Salisediminibacterium halotolerans]|uniref:DNA-binding transcriptional regulator, MarR family n=1 Tax=Salisediminibacterium halotolerans TaxID=517425 RepID=A0A1H9WTT0_9BACI|nr:MULTISPECIES: MarR family transcriptional regulator [Salisediminibacterium]RLJ74496.1 DNA-binding MarR family transcriptional regulator [Actinophytocola xinjiangensis]RPE87411.1 DNA-binding MarR family transcriptional regulator [Salisediminibacterium halotolerans]TWG35332.1 DNA-binding MarR family transcriptional regulator [Salisediminibacterium halotolerans]SES37087.1 DNA-binding transcriptional regulator, MarR family [Salisediminibacterium haloalkalitolerans]GEL07964.1 hypothetical protei
MKTDEIFAQIEENVIDISLALNHRFNSEIDNDLTPNQQLLLYLVGKKGVRHVKDLAYYMSVSASAISQMVAKLEQDSVIQREIDETNRRSTVLRLGERGQTLMDETDMRRSAIINDYLLKMNEKDLLEINSALKKLYTIIREEELERGDRR